LYSMKDKQESVSDLQAQCGLRVVIESARYLFVLLMSSIACSFESLSLVQEADAHLFLDVGSFQNLAEFFEGNTLITIPICF